MYKRVCQVSSCDTFGVFFLFSSEGVYRVSGSKPRIQKICQAFEVQKEQVDLSDLSPHDITSILKHFFKEVPEPLPNGHHTMN